MPASSTGLGQERRTTAQIALFADKTTHSKSFDSSALDEALCLPKIQGTRRAKSGHVNASSFMGDAGGSARPRALNPYIVHGPLRAYPLAKAEEKNAPREDNTLITVQKTPAHSLRPRRRSSFDAATFDAERPKTSHNGYKSSNTNNSTDSPAISKTRGMEARNAKPDSSLRSESSLSTITSRTNRKINTKVWSLTDHVERENAHYNEKQIKRFLFERWIKSNRIHSYLPVATEGDDLDLTRLSLQGGESW